MYFQADRDTDEIYAQMTLQPVNSVRNFLPLNFNCGVLNLSATSFGPRFGITVLKEQSKVSLL